MAKRTRRLPSGERVDAETGELVEDSPVSSEDLKRELVDAGSRESVRAELGKLVARAREVEEMTRTAGWRQFYASERRAVGIALEEHVGAIVEGNPMQLGALKEAMKGLRGAVKRLESLCNVVSEICEPVEALRKFARENALFLDGVKVKADWDERTGKVVVKADGL